MFTIVSLLSPWYPCLKGGVYRSYHRLFLRLFFPNFSLTAFSINSLQLLLCIAVVLHSPHTISWSLLTQFSRRILLFLTSFPSTFRASYLSPFFISFSPHNQPVFQHTPHQFLSQNFPSLLPSLPLSVCSHDFFSPVVYANLYFHQLHFV